MKSNERTIRYFDCIVNAYAAGRGAPAVPAKSMRDVLKHMKAHLQVTPTHRSTRDGNETWHVAEIDFDATEKKAIILINRSDRLAADQAVSDPTANQFIVNPKQGNQGNASSAHMAILLKPVKPNTYLAVLEDATGISTKDIETLFAQILREASRQNNAFFHVNDPSNDPALARTGRYRFTFVGHPSDDFKAELAAGKLQGISLSDFQGQDDFFDEGGYTVEKKKTIELKVRDETHPIWDTLKSVCKKADETHFASIRVKFTDSLDYQRSVEVDTRTMRLVNEQRFVKKARLTFQGRLHTGCEIINAEMRDKLFALI